MGGAPALGHYEPLVTDRYAAAKCAPKPLVRKPCVNFSNVTAALPRRCRLLQELIDSAGGQLMRSQPGKACPELSRTS